MSNSIDYGIQLPDEKHTCWLTRLTASPTDKHTCIYTLTLRPPRQTWYAQCLVPASHVGEATIRDLHLQDRIDIAITDASKAPITFLNEIVSEEGNCYVRCARVQFRSRDYEAEVHIPFNSKEGHRIHKTIELSKAVPSIEPIPIETPPRRTVDFLDPIGTGKKVRTVVSSYDGQSSYRGGGQVIKMEVMDGRRYLTIKAPVERGVMAYMVGDVGDAPFARSGRFEEVEDPDTKTSKVFWLPPWEEEQ